MRCMNDFFHNCRKIQTLLVCKRIAVMRDSGQHDVFAVKCDNVYHVSNVSISQAIGEGVRCR